MKKKILSFTTIISALFAGAVNCFAANINAVPAKSWSNFFEYFPDNHITIAVIIIFAVIIIAAVIMHKPIAAKLNKSTSDSMLNTFFVFFGICAIAGFVISLLSDGDTLGHLLHSETTETATTMHFYDYLNTLRDAGSMNFHKSAYNFSPMSLFIFYIIAQFMPEQYIFSTSLAHYLQMTRHQTFIYAYLILLMFLIVMLNKASKKILNKNESALKEEIFCFLLIVSYPTLYCIKLGNIVGLSYAFVLFFIAFRDSEKRITREMSIVSLAVSAAITPYTLIFALLLLSKDKNSIKNIIKATIYSVVLFILPAFFTGFQNLGTYLANLFVVPEFLSIENIAISNILRFIGIDNIVWIYILSAVFTVGATACIFILPETWQKATAILYVIITIVPSEPNAILLFAFIPLLLLVAQKTHKAVDWLYFIAFSFLIVPLPEWFWFERESFISMFESLNIYTVHNANELFAPFAVQLLFVLIVSQSISVLIKNKKENTIQKT